MLNYKYVEPFNIFINEKKYLKKGTWLQIKSKNCGITHLGRFISKKNNKIIILDHENDFRIMEFKSIKICHNMKIDTNININQNTIILKS